MKFRYKVAFFIVAVVVSLIAFNLIASPLVCMAKIGKEAQYEIISNYLAEAELYSFHPCPIPSK